MRPLLLCGLIMARQVLAIERYVLTFANSSVEAGLPMNGSFVVKQYGRRLVVGSSEPVALEDLRLHYGTAVLDVEPDLLVTTLETSTDIIENRLYSINLVRPLDFKYEKNYTDEATIPAPSVEWPFARDAQYGMQVERLWPLTNGSLETRIAVLDSGIAARHLFASVDPGYDFVSDPSYGMDGDGRDPDAGDPGSPSCPSWHGTKMAFAMAGRHADGLHSVAWNTTIQPVRVLGVCATGFANDVTDGIVWAAGGLINGLGHNPTPAQIISMSFGGRGGCPSYLQSAIDMAVRQFGVVVIASAGNQGSNASEFFPANCRGVVTVAASLFEGYVAPYSNTGKEVALSAPGGSALHPIATPDFGDGVSSSWGSSFSAAFTAGFLALKMSQLDGADPRWVLQKSTVIFNRYDLRTKEVCIRDVECGTGILSSHISNAPVEAFPNVSSLFIETSAPFTFPVSLVFTDLLVHGYAYDTLGNYGTPSSSAMGGGTLSNMYDGMGTLAQWSIYPYNFGTTCTSSPTLAWVQYDMQSVKALTWIFILPYTGDRSYCYLTLQVSWTGSFAGEQEIVYACGMTAGTYCPPIPLGGLNVSLPHTMGRYVRWSMGGNSLGSCCTGSFFIQFLVGNGVPNWCQAGTYFTGAGISYPSECTKCDAGKYSIVQNAKSPAACISCEAGKYAAPGSNQCLSNSSDLFALVMEGNGKSCNGGRCMRKVDLRTLQVSTFTGNAITPSPYGGSVDIAPSGDFALIADFTGCTILLLNLITGVSSIIAGTAGNSGRSNGLGKDALFFNPASISVHPNRTFALVADYNNHAIRKITLMNNVYNVYMFAGTCSSTACTSGSGDGWTLGCTFNKPASIAIDPSGSYAFVGEWGNCKIRKIDFFNGYVGFQVTTFAGSGTCVATATDSITSLSTFGNIFSVKFSADANHLLVADRGTKTIRTVSKHSSIASTMASLNNIGDFDVETSVLGTHTFVVDTSQNVIKVMQGSFVNLLGNGAAATVDGVGTSASFNAPVFMAVWRNNIPGFGSYADPVSRVVCPAGTYSSSTGQCVQCRAGNYSAAGATACIPCPQGQYASPDNTKCLTCAFNYSSSDKSVCTFMADLPMGYWNVSDIPNTVVPVNWYYCNAACCCGPPPTTSALPTGKGIVKWDNKGYGVTSAYLWIPIGNAFFNNDDRVLAARWGPGSLVYVSIKSGASNYLNMPVIDSSVCFAVMGAYWTKSNWGSYQQLGYDSNGNGQIDTTEIGPGFYNSYQGTTPDGLYRGDRTTAAYAFPVNYPYIHSRIVMNICTNMMVYQVQGVGPDRTPFSQWVSYGAWTNANLNTGAATYQNPYLWNGILLTASADAFRTKMVYVKAYKKGYVFSGDQNFVPCSPGLFWFDSQTCAPCPANTTSVAGILAITDCYAAAGYYGAAGSAAAVCPSNHYCPAGSVAPVQCPPNTVSGAGSSALGNCTTLVCPANHQCSSGSPEPCPANTGSAAGSVCSALAGYYGAAGSAAAVCPSNHYCPAGSTVPTPCPANSYSAQGSLNAHFCRCNAGYFCVYAKTVSAVISLRNVSVYAFENDVGGVRTSFVASLAAAMGVSPSKISIARVSASGSRRLLGLALRVYVRIHETGVHTLAHRHKLVHFTVEEWSERYEVRVKPRI